MDIGKDLTIDKYHLDEECVSQASLYWEYSEACAQAKQEMGDIADRVKVTLAACQMHLREEANQKGTKLTEATVSAMVDIDTEVVAIRAAYRQAEATYLKMQVAVQALDTKRSELDNMVKLYQTGYFSLRDNSTGMTQGDRRTVEYVERTNQQLQQMKEAGL